jgi:hypothetical protein
VRVTLICEATDESERNEPAILFVDGERLSPASALFFQRQVRHFVSSAGRVFGVAYVEAGGAPVVFEYVTPDDDLHVTVQ